MKTSILIPTLASLILLSAPINAEESESYSIEDLYYSVDQVSEPSDKILLLEDIVEQHQRNKHIYRRALTELLNQYEENDETDKAMLLAVSAYTEYMEFSHQQDIELFEKELKRLTSKYPDLVNDAADKVNRHDVKIKPIENYSSDELIESVIQREDENIRENALEQIAALLAESSTDLQKKKGLQSLGKSMTAKFNREPFLRIVMPLLKSEDEEVRALSVATIAGLEFPKEQLSTLTKMVDDESDQVRDVLARTIIVIDRGENQDLVIPVLMKLLQDDQPYIRESTIRSMWGEYTSEEFDKFLVDLSFDPKLGYWAVYHGLSTMKTKGVIVSKRLVEVLDDKDWNRSGRAAWGLGYGVEIEAYKIVEEGLLKALPEETNDYTRRKMFNALRNVASEQSRSYLEKVVNSDLETDHSKELAANILSNL